MLSKAELKTLRSLHDAKGRTAEGSFIAEGLKVIEELLGAFPCSLLIVSLALAEEAKARLLHLAPKARPQRVEVVPESLSVRSVSLRVHSPSLPSLPRCVRVRWQRGR